MGQFKLYIATTIDGFIAREDGSLDWLTSLPVPEGEDYGYQKFYDTIDTVVMGSSTYKEILGFNVPWPYAGGKSFIFSSNPEFSIETENTELVNELNSEAVELIKSQSSKNIWIVGGGKIISAFLKLGVVDEIILTIVPVILGQGIRLFPTGSLETKFELSGTESFETGLVNLYYKKIN